ncbi:MAG: hydroxymethylbilane synthase [Desulfobacterales bacterium]|nr:hydroxymethylbilane synthase [Desulfobacterales bacterium]
MKKIKIGSRKSKLALWQSETVAAMLNRQGLSTEIITMETRGDKILNTPIAKIGSKGVFTEEIETMLKKGEVDLAVHSAKDMPSRLPAGFSLIAFTKREKTNDVLLSFDCSLSLENKDKPQCIGTSSVRRVAMLRHFYPHVTTVDMRGNLQTRIKKMKAGECDALMLAYAGVKRMDYDHLIVRELPNTDFVPPVGQGSIAIEVFDSIDPNLKRKIRECINHPPTEAALTAERAYLKKLQGGCSIPAFALAECTGETIRLTAGLISLDGRMVLKKILIGEKKNAIEIGKKVGLQILKTGGREILDKINRS